jgi:hypothetical protein
MIKHLKKHDVPRKRSAVRAFVFRCQTEGRYGFSLTEVEAATGLSRLAAAAQLRRMLPAIQQIGRRVPYYLAVPPEHASRGAPPVSWWLDGYMAFLKRPYYVGLLSAAAVHGSAHQAVQETQVLTDIPLPMLDIGRLRVRFFTKKTCTLTPVFQPPGMPATLRVSTAEATALDLIRYAPRIGGIERAREVIAELLPALSARRFKMALGPEIETAAIQRLGWTFDQLGAPTLAGVAAHHLRARRLQPVLLETRRPRARFAGTMKRDPQWGVLTPVSSENSQ